jgi:hypothetical protein
MRKPALCAAVAAAFVPACAAIAPASAAAAPVRVSYHDSFATRTPGAATARSFGDAFTNAADPQAKPEPITHFHSQLPAGSRIDTGAVPQCGASDAELMLSGPGGCPAGSKLGTEVLVIDTGGPGSSRFATEDVTFLNNRDQIILVNQDRQSGARVITRGVIGRDTEDFDIPPLPGTPPEGGAVKSEEGGLNAAGPYTIAPPTCPASGTWVFKGTWTFQDGSKQSVQSASPCASHTAAAHRRAHRRHRKHHRRHHRHRRP